MFIFTQSKRQIMLTDVSVTDSSFIMYYDSTAMQVKTTIDSQTHHFVVEPS